MRARRRVKGTDSTGAVVQRINYSAYGQPNFGPTGTHHSPATPSPSGQSLKLHHRRNVVSVSREIASFSIWLD